MPVLTPGVNTRQLLVGALLRRTRRHLVSFSRGQFVTITASITANQTNITFAGDVTNIPVGSYVAIEDEVVYVQSVQATTQSLGVIRGMDGTAAVAHDGTVTPIVAEVNPRYPTGAIREALLEEIRSWSPHLFRVRTGVLLTNIGTRGYDIGPSGPYAILDPNWIEVLEVRRSTNQSGLAYGYNALVKTWPRVPFRVDRLGSPGFLPGTNIEAPVAAPSGPNQQQGAVTQFQGGYPHDFASGVMLTIKANYYNTQMAITWATELDPPDPLTDTTDLVAAGIDASWGEIAEYGAAARLLTGKESLRNTVESAGESRHATEVPPQAIGQQSDRLMRLRDKAFVRCVRQLASRYPTRFKS